MSREAESRRKPILHFIKKKKLIKIREITLFTSVLRGITKVLLLFTIIYYEILNKSPESEVLHMSIQSKIAAITIVNQLCKAQIRNTMDLQRVNH